MKAKVIVQIHVMALPVSSLQKDRGSVDQGYRTSEKAFRIVLAGDAAVGKSSFLLRLCKNEFKLNSSATLGESEETQLSFSRDFIVFFSLRLQTNNILQEIKAREEVAADRLIVNQPVVNGQIHFISF